MAKLVSSAYRGTTKKKRPGVHAKTKTSKLKQSKNYRKLYKGQGKWVKIHQNRYTTILWIGEIQWLKEELLKLIRKKT